MAWLIIATGSYLLGAFTVVLDKFLLGSKRIASPAVYAFYINLLGIGTLVLVPFGFSIPSPTQIIASIISGIAFSMGILALYYAIKKSDPSQVIPVIGAVTPIMSLILAAIFLGEKIDQRASAAVALLISGGLLISFDLPLRLNKKKFFAGFYISLLSGAILAVAYVMFKFVYSEQAFLSGFMWTRIGAFCSMVILLAVPVWRRDIFSSLKKAKRPQKQDLQTGALFVSNKLLGGISSIMFNYAIATGSVTLVNSMNSLQYVFIMLISMVAMRRWPEIFGEKLKFWDWAQRWAAVAMIGVGIALLSLSGYSVQS